MAGAEGQFCQLSWFGISRAMTVTPIQMVRIDVQLLIIGPSHMLKMGLSYKFQIAENVTHQRNITYLC